jgi:DNA-binding beta-propeller fold protein YncE
MCRYLEISPRCPGGRVGLLLLPLVLVFALLAQGGTLQRLARGEISPNLANNDEIFESSYRNDTVEIFTSRGVFAGLLAKLAQPTGMAFDAAGNLFVASNQRPNFSITKFATDGSQSIFADNSLLNAPHGLAFDAEGNLFVANSAGNTIVKFTPEGIGSIFADFDDGLVTPIAVAFDTAGNLYVTNADGGGPPTDGRVLKFTPDGVGSVFNGRGFDSAYGLAFDRDGNLYVSNFDSSVIEKFAADGTDLGIFASSDCNHPLGIMFDRNGSLYVANQGNATIERYSRNGTDMGAFATTRGGPHFLVLLKVDAR